MTKLRRLFSAVMAGLTLFSMAPVNAETYNGEIAEDEVTQTESPETSNSTKKRGGGLDNTIPWLRNLFLPQVFAAEDDIARGTSGGVTWVIDSEGTLTLSPTNGISGTMESLTHFYDSVPWYDYKFDIKKAVAEPGVALGQNANNLFFNCSNLSELDLNNLNTGNVTNMYQMFLGCKNLTSLDGLAGWNTGSVTNMNDMFSNCSSLTSIDGLVGWDTGSVTNMRGMFTFCSGLTSLEPLADWDTGSVTNMRSVFSGCCSLASLESLADWETRSVTDMSNMFNGCSSVESADFSGWKFPSSSNRERMFFECSSLSKITISDSITFDGTNLPYPQETDVYTGNWTYGDPYNHNPEDILTNTQFCTGTHKAGTWYWERKGEKPLAQHYISNSDNIFVPEYIENDDGSTSLKQLPEELFTEDGYWQQQDDNTWVYTFYVFDASVQWYIWEEPVPDGYTSSATRDNPIVIENGSIVSTITNTLETEPKTYGRLSIQKQLVDDTQTLDTGEQTFPFRITLSDETNQPLSGVDVFGGIIFNNGVAYQSVSPSQTLEISGIPAGYHYTVEELPDDKYIQEITNHTGIIQPDNEDVTTYVDDTTGLVVATNTRIPEPDRTYGSLTLRKTVTGNTDTDESFNLVVSFNNLEPDTTYTYGDKTFSSDSHGSADVAVSLKNNEEVTFNNLPTDSQYRIMEEAGNYTSSYTITDANNQGMINQTNDNNEIENEELVTAMETLDKGEEVTVEFINKINKKQKVSIAKIVKESNGEVITDDSRYEFNVEFTDAGADTEITSALGVLRTNEEGNASASFFLQNGETLEFSGVPAGAKYRFTEVENNAIASYTITDTLENDSVIKQNDANTTVKQALSTEFETVDNNEDSTVTFTNTYIKGALTVIKRSSDGDLLMGAEFRLTGSDGTAYEPENIATDANGQITWNELPFDTYTLTETKAPAGATLMKEPIQIEIKSDNPDISIEVTDNSAIFLDAGGTGLITWMTVSSAILALGTAFLLDTYQKKKRYGL